MPTAAMSPSSVIAVVRGHLAVDACARVLAALRGRDRSTRLEWQRGRQGSGYDKANLLDHRDGDVGVGVDGLVAVLGAPSAFDAWWLVYPTGSGIPAHTDPPPIDDVVHLRANLVLATGDGGGFVADDVDIALGVGDLVVFRPDVVRHAVGTVTSGERHVLSVGTIWPAERASDIVRRAHRP